MVFCPFIDGDNYSMTCEWLEVLSYNSRSSYFREWITRIPNAYRK